MMNEGQELSGLQRREKKKSIKYLEVSLRING